MATLARNVLRDQIREILLERILAGAYGPGERIKELQVARELSVSQGPVREAMRELEHLGLVVSEPHRGARVRQLTPRELAESHPVRAAIEEVAACEAAPRLDGDVAALERELAAMHCAARAGDVRELLVHDVLFHRLIVEASGNQTLAHVWRSLRIEARTLITLVRTDADLGEIADAHRPVLEALRHGDGPRAGCVLREHIERYRPLWFPPEPVQ